MADLIGQTLGNYRIESRLGSGGMGDVYRAVHLRLNRPAALKVLHAMLSQDPTFQARFLREARAAAALSHPNIVEVFDFGEQDSLSYLVMELVPDGSLRSLLRQRAKGEGWSLGLGVDLVRQAAEGLAYAHARGMAHRDIKPDNLLLQRLETPPRAAGAEPYLLKISDFGLARLMDDSGELTQTGVVMGTPTYMSPEQCQGGALDGRSDLYSLGVVLYEVATGAPPFRVKTLSEAVFKHISTPPVPPSEVFPDLPPALEEVIMRCLAKRPEDRYTTGTELADALDGALGDTELRTIVSTIASTGLATPSSGQMSGQRSGQGSSEASTPSSTPESVAPTPALVPVPAGSAEPASAAEAVAEPVVEPAVEPAVEPMAASGPTISQANALTVAATPAEPPETLAGVEPDGLGAATAAAVSTSLAIEGDSTILATPTPATPDAPAQADPSARADLDARERALPTPKPWTPAAAAQAPARVGDARDGGLIARLQALPEGARNGGALVAVLLVTALVIVLISRPQSAPAKAHITPTATARPAPTASPTPIENITYQAPLTSATRSWPNSAHSFFANGGYELTGAWIAYAPSGRFGDGSVSTQARQVSGASNLFYGLLLRGAGNNLYYFYGVNGSQQWTFALVRDGNGQPIVAATTDTHINAGLNATNTLTVRAAGSHFTFYINGAQVGQADDATIAAGELAVINPSGDLSVVYNNFTVAG
ncbi:MAG TPA: protein kinase [Ktedonobacterales bacterium]|jgi:serine/threonine protein kinase|nr:protein kinase [Ktedonobacterales bacterium]